MYVVTHTHRMEYYSTIKMNEILPFTATWMDVKIIILSEVRQKDKYCMIITYMWNLKNDTNELIYKTQTLIENKLTTTKRER